MAIDAMIAIREAGLSVWVDISVFRFDDIEIASVVVPWSTKITQLKEELAHIGSDLLIGRLRGKLKDANQHKFLRGRLIIRESTAWREE